MPSQNEFSIGEVAQATGLSVHALRFYEREGLMLAPRVARAAGQQRRYTEQDLHWLRICIKLRASGMPLATIRRYAGLVRGGPGNERQRLELLRDHQRQVEQQLAELEGCLQTITHKAAVYEEHLARGDAEGLYAPRS